MHVLVTGAAGLLGTELCLQLSRDHCVTGVDNLSRYELLGEEGTRPQGKNVNLLFDSGVCFYRRDFRDVLDLIPNVDAVVHAAAQVCHSRKNDNPLDDVNINVVGTVQLLESAKQKRTPVLFISSSKVYGTNCDDGSYAMDETCPLGDQTHITFFGASKASADLFAQMYSMKYDFQVGVFRPGCFTGPRALATEAQNWLPWLIHCARSGRTFNIFGDGTQVRDLLHVSDLAAACMLWLKSPRSGVWNLGGADDSVSSLNEAIKLVEHMLDVKVKREYKPRRAGDIDRLVLDSYNFKKEYAWKHSFTLDQIFRDVIEGTRT